ncbi:MAG: hypothetical protein AB1730_00355 [Myxococcota bacterium]
MSLTASAVPITIDATALESGYGLVIQPGAAWESNGVVHAYDLAPGAYTFQDNTNVRFDFTVTAAGTVDYPAVADGFVSGRGTPSLVIAGYPVTVDATALATASTFIAGGKAYHPRATPWVLRAMPGTYLMLSTTGGSMHFDITPAGALTVAPADAAAATVSGTTLVLSGLPVTFDATALEASPFFLAGGAFSYPATGPQTVRLLPGAATFVDSTLHRFDLTLSQTGAVQVEPGVASAVSVAGTVVTVSGLAITIDASAIGDGAVSWGLSGGRHNGAPSPLSGAQTVRLLPGSGPYTWVTAAQVQSFQFTVDASGAVTYPSAKDVSQGGFLRGSGTSTLIVEGFPVVVDASTLSESVFTVRGLMAVNQPSNSPVTLRLIPATNYSLEDGGGHTYLFGVDDAGHVTYASGLEGELTGAGTTTLSVHGLSLTFDATALGISTAYVAYVDWFDATQPRCLSLFPSGAIPFRVIVGATTTFLTLSAAGGPSLSPPVSGLSVTAGCARPPLAVAGPPQTLECPALATLDGRASSDPLGLSLSYAWSTTSGTPVASTPVASVALGSPGTTGFSLTVTNSAGISSSGATSVTVVDTRAPAVTTHDVVLTRTHRAQTQEVPLSACAQAADECAGTLDLDTRGTVVNVQAFTQPRKKSCVGLALASPSSVRVPLDHEGDFVVTFDVTDASGNAARASCRILVRNPAPSCEDDDNGHPGRGHSHESGHRPSSCGDRAPDPPPVARCTQCLGVGCPPACQQPGSCHAGAHP